jgi:signal transduction histidine kinase
MKKYLLLLWCCLLSLVVAAQLPDLSKYKTDKAKLEAVKKFCQKMVEKERYDSLMLGGRQGLAIAQRMKNDTTISVYNFYIGAGYEYSNSPRDSAIKYYQISEKYGMRTGMSERIINPQQRIVFIASLATIDTFTNKYVGKLEAELKQYKDPKTISSIAGALAPVYQERHQYDKAVNAYITDLEIKRKLKDSVGIGTSMVNLGNLYTLILDNDKAQTYFTEALPYLDNYAHGQMVCYYNLAAVYINKSRNDLAINYFQKGLAIARKLNDPDAINGINIKLGTIYVEQKQYARAEPILLACIDYAVKVNDWEMLSDGNETMGQLYNGKKEYPAAINWYQKALLVSTHHQLDERTAEIYQRMATAAEAARNYQMAYQYQVSYVKMKDSLAQQSSKKSIKEVETKYQTTQKEEKIKLLSQQQKVQELELQVQRRTRYYLSAGLILLLVIAGLMFRSYRIKQNANNALEEKNTELQALNAQLDEANRSKTKLFSILSHDLRAPIGSVFQFINLQKNYPAKFDPVESKKHNERILQSAENLMGTMEDILIWSKSQMDSFSLNMVTINACELIEQIIDLHQDFANERQVVLKKDCSSDIFINSDENFLKIVLRNIVSNGIKFTPPGGDILISAYQQSGIGQFKIYDNGVGMTKEQIANVFEWNSIRSDSSGLGLKLAYEFITRLGGTIDIDSTVGKGTTFIITVPQKIS